jgi:long-chain acyl-CoA synthetase
MAISHHTPDAAAIAEALKKQNVTFSLAQFDSFKNYPEAFLFNANQNGSLIKYDQAQINLQDTTIPRQYAQTLTVECKERVLRIAAYLQKVGIGRGDRVAIISRQRPEWSEAEIAVFSCGAAVVNAYVRDKPERLGFVLRDAQATYAIVENQEQLQKLLSVMHSSDANGDISLASKIRGILSFDQTSVPPEYARMCGEIPTFGQILLDNLPLDESELGSRGTTREDLANIIYTSGTTGSPKGVSTTHGQMLSNIRQNCTPDLVNIADYVFGKIDTVPAFTCFLPERAHAYISRVDQTVFATPTRARFPAILDRQSSQLDSKWTESLLRDLREGGAGIVMVVPKVLIKMQQEITSRLANGPLSLRTVGRMIAVEQERLMTEARGEPVSLSTRAMAGLFRSPLQAITQKFVRPRLVGPEFLFFVSGGGPLPLETEAFFFAIGLPVYQGYGTTETNCSIAVNTPTQHRPGSCGKVMSPDIEVKIEAETGQLLVRGPNIAREYLNRPDETARTWTSDGFLRTPDLARIKDGYIYIGDRSDDMMVMANGEKVSPAEVQKRFAAIPYVENAIVVGHKRTSIVALVALNIDAVRKWAEGKKITLEEDLRHDPRVKELIRDEVRRNVNERGNREYYDTVRNIAIIDPLSVQDGTLTSSDKPMRKSILSKYSDLIDSLYAKTEEWLPAVKG